MLIGNSFNSSAIPGDSRSAAAEAQLEEDLNRFLTLLVTQLQNQDPLDPLDSNEFTSQLVQFASVEQQIFQNANLEKLVALQETNQISSLVDFIGTTVEAEGNQLPLENGFAEFTYTIPTNANNATITITNEAGLTVFQSDADTSSGKHVFQWDGSNQFGIPQPDGAYTVVVSALDFSGNLLEVTHTIIGRVTGAGVDDGLASLFMGDAIVIPQDKVLSVKETKTADSEP